MKQSINNISSLNSRRSFRAHDALQDDNVPVIRPVILSEAKDLRSLNSRRSFGAKDAPQDDRVRWVKMLILIASLLMSSPLMAKEETAKEPEKAGGIRTDFGDVLIENLGIGKTYNLRDLAGMPMKIENTGKGTINLVMDVVIPKPEFITPIRKEMGYEPIPSPDWVTLTQSQFIVPSGESALTDVIIKIPDDPSYYGKRYQASIYSRTTGNGFLNLGVWSHLQITIAKSKEDQDVASNNFDRGIVGNMDYTLLPDKVVIQNFPLGERFNIKKGIKKTIIVANSGETMVDIRVKTVSIGDTPLTLQSGYEVPESLSWISLKSTHLKVEPSSFADPGIEIEIPKGAKYSKKKYMFVLKFEPADPKVIGVTYYGKIYVETQ